jgi:hypothetical protein
MTAIREVTRVKPDRTVEICTPVLLPGEEVEVIVLASFSQLGPTASSGRLKADWGGALEDLGGKYTSIELQRKAQDWWGD